MTGNHTVIPTNTIRVQFFIKNTYTYFHRLLYKYGTNDIIIIIITIITIGHNWKPHVLYPIHRLTPRQVHREPFI